MATATVPNISTEESERQQWLAQRRTGIGGSDVIHLLNEPQYGKGCQKWLAFDKLGVPEDYPQVPTAGQIRRGTKLESLVAEEYSEKTGRELRRQPSRVNKDYPWARVNMDRQALAGTGNPGFEIDKTGAVEIKTFGEWPFRKMVREQKLLPGTALQIQHTMFVTGYDWTAFAGMEVSHWDLMHFDVPRDEQTIDIIKREGDKFWTMKEKGQLPAPLPNPEDERCRVCTYRKTCRGSERDHAFAAQLEKSKDKPKLVRINDPALNQSFFDREVLLSEIKERKELLEVVNGEIKDKLQQELIIATGSNLGAYAVDGSYGYLKRTSWTGLDQKAHKAAEPACHEKYYVRNRLSDKITLLVYGEKQEYEQ
jgi:hypothetical protein